MKQLVAILLILLAGPVFADGKSVDDMYFGDKQVSLTPQEKRGVAIAHGQAGASASEPARGQNGAVSFAYGAARPSIVCAVFQPCDIQLQVGEMVQDIKPGDTVRWSYDPAISGSGANQVQHIIVTPHDVGLETGLTVTTNRRTYSIELKSSRHDYMPTVTFSYPGEVLAKWKELQAKRQVQHEHHTMPDTGEYLGDLNFDYDIEGSAPWKPVRVYNDGKHTIIQLPERIAAGEAPVLLVLREKGGLFTKEKKVVVNYRVQRDRYIVDTVFHKAVLVAGVGSDQTRVIITREE